ncbi:MAG: efflux RND transporter periplasmic adaptor subunit [Planctomycetota bacterium]
MRRTITTLLVLVALAALAYGIQRRLGDLAAGDVSAGVQRAPAPVEVADVVQGEVVLRRTFSGTLEASSSFSVAPKVSGRLRGLDVDIGDAVERGQVVALLDDDEFVQAVNQADAELAVARASESEARSALEIAERALARAEALQKEGLASDSILDDARSDSVAARAHVEVTKAQVARAESALESARIRSGYTRVVADWGADAGRRVVAERFVDDGEIVSANTALLSIVQLDPVVAVVSVPERDYARLAVGQPATLVTDSYPGRTFDGAVSRIAPVFRAATRQARVELTVANPARRNSSPACSCARRSNWSARPRRRSCPTRR